jgi:hypothetical protein
MPFTLPASSGAASLTDAATTEAQQKTNLTNLRGFLAEMLGTDSTSRDVARSLLGIDHPVLTFAVGSNALTIALKTPAGADATVAAPLTLAFRSATLSSGVVNVRKLTAAASLVISSGSTLGTASAKDAWLYVYALDNSGNIELAISGTYYGEQFIGSTTAEGGGGAADSKSTIYSTTLRSSVAMRLLAAVRSNQTTAGAWAAVPVECRLAGQGAVGTGLGMHRAFESADQTVTPNSTLTVAHGFGVRPQLVKLTLKCVTAEANYSQDDECDIIQTVPGVSVIQVSADTTNVVINYTGSNTQVLNKTTQAATTITSANWRFVVRAWA